MCITFCAADHKKLIPRLHKVELIAISFDAEQRPLMNRVAAPFFLYWTDLKADYETFLIFTLMTPNGLLKWGKLRYDRRRNRRILQRL